MLSEWSPGLISLLSLSSRTLCSVDMLYHSSIFSGELSAKDGGMLKMHNYLLSTRKDLWSHMHLSTNLLTVGNKLKSTWLVHRRLLSKSNWVLIKLGTFQLLQIIMQGHIIYSQSYLEWTVSWDVTIAMKSFASFRSVSQSQTSPQRVLQGIDLIEFKGLWAHRVEICVWKLHLFAKLSWDYITYHHVMKTNINIL